jgi:hypothetical protein
VGEVLMDKNRWAKEENVQTLQGFGTGRNE